MYKIMPYYAVSIDGKFDVDSYYKSEREALMHCFQATKGSTKQVKLEQVYAIVSEEDDTKIHKDCQIFFLSHNDAEQKFKQLGLSQKEPQND